MTDRAYPIELREPARRNGALAAVSCVGAMLALAASPLGIWPMTIAMGLFATVAAVVVARLPAFHPFPVFGAANFVTLLRAALLSLLTPLVLLDGLRAAAGPAIFGLAATILLLDGLDGWLARRLGTVSRFGARFDMEVDALLIMVLACFAWLAGKADGSVLILGLMRYVFVAAGFILPALARDLPPSQRRKLVCVAQIVILSLLTLPQFTPPLSGHLALAALVLLAWSFLIDTLWLLRRERG